MKVRKTEIAGPQFVEGLHKEVVYFGHNLIVPKETIAICADADGEVYAFQNTQPIYDQNYDVWFSPDFDNDDCVEVREIVAVIVNKTDAENSLVEYEME